MKLNIEPNVYETKDLYEASFLYASGCLLLRLEKTEKDYYFVFLDSVFCSNLSNEYWNYSSQIPAKKLTDAIKSLKERLFSNRK